MSTNVYNFTNQRLDADRLREVQKFNSDNFGGVIADTSPFKIEGTNVSLIASQENPVLFLGGGLLLSQTENVSRTLTSNNEIWYLEVFLDKESGSITSDNLINSFGVEQVSFNSAVCDYFEINNKYTFYSLVKELGVDYNPHDNDCYVYENGKYSITGDTEVVDGTSYYHKVDATRFTFRTSGLGTLNYFGNTLWLNSSSFIIPLCVRNGDEIVQLVTIKSVEDLEWLFSADSYARLKKYCDTTFVWSVGGQEEVIDTDGNAHKKGDIGELNITDNVISNENGSVVASSLAIKDFEVIDQATASSLPNYSSSVFSPRDKLALDSTGKVYKISNYRPIVESGGTYSINNWDTANPKLSAKQNLGIYYGTNGAKSPSEKNPIPSPKIGDIYFWIIE